MIEAAEELIRTRGLHDTSFTEVLNRSGATRGTIYHHFPDGKQELAREAVALTRDRALEGFRGFDHSSPEAFVDDFIVMLNGIATSDGGPGCAVGAVVQDAGAADAALRETAAGTFGAWTDALADELAQAGVPAERARPLATLMLATLEGSHLLCRAAGSTAPLDSLATGLRLAIGSAQSP